MSANIAGSVATPHDTADLEPDLPPLVVAACGRSDRGKKRESNEDQFAVAELAKIMRVDQTSLSGPDVRINGTPVHLFVVADGMGGYAGGELASQLAIQTVEESLLNSLSCLQGNRGAQAREVEGNLQAALAEADQRVLDESTNPKLRNMGSTLTLAFQYGRELFVAHVGDSRAYLCRDRGLHRMTHDHTLYAKRARTGDLPAEPAELSRLHRTITNAIGAGVRGVQPEMVRVKLEDGDRLLLCTDGLTEMVKDVDIATVLAEHLDPDAACDRLVALANENGGRDNITVIVAVFEAGKKRSAEA